MNVFSKETKQIEKWLFVICAYPENSEIFH